MCYCFCHKYDTPQYLSQVKWDLHKTTSIFQDWSPKWINNVCGHAHAHLHTQSMQMKSEFYETLYEHQGGIKHAPKIIWKQHVHACKHNGHKHACTFLYLANVFQQCRIWGWCRKFKLLRRVQWILKTTFTHLDQYVHACEHNAHKYACTFIYLAIAFKRAELWGEKGNKSCSEASIVYSQKKILEQYVHACEHNVHKCACMLLYWSA